MKDREFKIINNTECAYCNKCKLWKAVSRFNKDKTNAEAAKR